MRARLQERLSAHELALLERAGCLAADLGMGLYVAGGSVRDVMLGRDHEDWDLVVVGDGPRFARALAGDWGGEAVIHEAFLTAKVRLPGRMALDVATARRESYQQPGALPTVAPAAMEEDLWRRDFSVNAIAFSVSPRTFGKVLDPTGGLKDLSGRLVRALHSDSFWDDATRIVRGVGFEQRLGFTIEPDTEAWIRVAAANGALETVSTERLGEALLPLLRNHVGPQVLLRGAELGIAAAWGARAAFTRRSLGALEAVPRALEHLGEAGDPESRAVACLAALLLGRGVSAEAVMERLHLDRVTAKELRAAARQHEDWPKGFRPAPGPGDRWLQLREASFGGVVALYLSTEDGRVREALASYWTRLRHVRPDISGPDFAALGFRAGPAYAAGLAAATRAKLNRDATRDEQLAAAVAIMQLPPPQDR